jgi:hypothetical protein
VEGSRSIAGSQRISTKNITSIPVPVIQQRSSSQNVPSTITLPMHSDELGRLPLHSYLDSSDQGNATFDVPSNCWHPIIPTDRNTSDLSHHIPHTDPTGMAGMSASLSFPNDQRFYDQITLPFANLPSSCADPPHYHSGNFDGPRSTSVRSGGHYESMPGHASTIDGDTIAMWSNAPTGFE